MKEIVLTEEELEKLRSKICDGYCKYPDSTHMKYLADRFETKEEAQEYLTEQICSNCPLIKL